MASKIKKIFTNTRVLILLALLIAAFFLINPTFSDGVAIRSVSKDSAASEASPFPIQSPNPNVKPTRREVILSIDGTKIETLKDYYDYVEIIRPGQTFTLKTNKATYFLEQRYINKTIITEEGLTETREILQDIGINVYARPSNNIQKGLDLEGGTRVLLAPVGEFTREDLDITVTSIEQRLNVYGVGDISVRTSSDLFGNYFVTVEIPGVNEEEVKQLLSGQGKFEATIGNEVVFRGGSRDVLYICRTASCAGLDPQSPCSQVASNEHLCRFRFSITISSDAAKKMADITRELDIEYVGTGIGNAYLSENISLYLDDEKVDELRIGSELKGNAITDISISGSGSGTSLQEARNDALQNMKNLQTVLTTGSLPVKLEIVKTDSISPTLGSGFIKNAVLAGLFAIIAVVSIIAIRYREWKVSIPIVVTIVSEVVLTMAFAAAIGWRFDIAAIAAIIIAVGSGVDDQIIISDETLGKKKKREDQEESWKKKISRAFFIIMASYFTLSVAMVPLLFAGAGLLKGFALTTIAAVTIGVFITRPAFAEILKVLIEE